MRLRQGVYEGGARSEAREHVRRSVVGLERECQIQACQLFDACSALRARLIEDGRNNTRSWCAR
jgi:hypothetical protein